MKHRFLLFALICLLCHTSMMQAQIYNGDLELWRMRSFRCCGSNVDLPQDWGIPEQSCNMNLNQFVYLETDSFNVHSGAYSAKLFSDTTSINHVGLEPGILIYGGYPDPYDSAVTIGQTIQNFGLPIDSNPLGLTFWLKTSNGMADTFSYVYILTRWDSIAGHDDTLAYHTKDLPDSQVPQDEWFSVTDSISYLSPGRADTLRLIFYNGRFGNTALYGNTTWIDDIAFYYDQPRASGISTGSPQGTNTGIAQPVADQFEIYPNPAAQALHISAKGDVIGDSYQISDYLGRMVDQAGINATLSTADISRLAQGYYILRISDGAGHSLYQGQLTIVR